MCRTCRTACGTTESKNGFVQFRVIASSENPSIKKYGGRIEGKGIWDNVFEGRKTSNFLAETFLSGEQAVTW